MDTSAKVRAFQSKFAANDPATQRVRAALSRLFEERAAGRLPGDRGAEADDARASAELIDQLEELAGRGPLADESLPASARALPTFMIFEDYVTFDGRRFSLYGVDDFDEMNGEEGLVGSFKARGTFPLGVFALGQDLFIDTRGEVQSTPGAILKAIGGAVEHGKVLAPSLPDFLECCE